VPEEGGVSVESAEPLPESVVPPCLFAANRALRSLRTPPSSLPEEGDVAEWLPEAAGVLSCDLPLRIEAVFFSYASRERIISRFF